MLDIVFRNLTTDSHWQKDFFEKIIQAAIGETRLDKKNVELSVSLVGHNRIKNLNWKYRHKNRPTDVLAFPLNTDGLKTQTGDIISLGDIFVCLPKAKSDARLEKIPVAAKLVRLAIHGFLHLLGYDHEKSEIEQKKMELLENKILKKLI